jgi:uncharacterized OB-fold protein
MKLAVEQREGAALDANASIPAVNADSKPYWDAARQGKLILKHCLECRKAHFPPRHLCPSCWGPATEWIESKGWGSVYSFTVMRRAPTPEFAARVPYVVALVDLDEGPRMMANVVGENALSVQLGDRVRVRFEKRGDADFAVPQFTLAGPTYAP